MIVKKPFYRESLINKKKKFRSFKSKENIHKKPEDGQYLDFGYKSLISDPTQSG